MEHYANYHGVFTRILKDMGLLDAREDLSRTGVKFSRPKIERVFTAGPVTTSRWSSPAPPPEG